MCVHLDLSLFLYKIYIEVEKLAALVLLKSTKPVQGSGLKLVPIIAVIGTNFLLSICLPYGV